MRRSSGSNSAVLAAVAFVLAAVFAGAAWLFLPRAESALVLDEAELMTEAQRAFVAKYHRYLRQDHDIDYRIVTAREAGDINLYAVERFASLGAGAESRAGRGLLLVVDAAQDLVRLEVGYALEGAFPDAFVAYIEERQMVPFFRADRVADGILATTELIVTRAQRAAADAGFESEAWIAGSGGAGATTEARLGAGREPVPASSAPADATGQSPEATLATYLQAMAARDADPTLDLYTPETRIMLRDWVMTPAQMDSVVRTYRACRAEPARFGPGGRLAVIRYPIAERACAPWFFEQSGGRWRLDLTMMQRAIRFGRSNAWHFEPQAEHPYRFAFADWRFDARGFPQH